MKSFLMLCLCCLTAGILFGQELLEAPKFSVLLFHPKRELSAGTLVPLECNTVLYSDRLSIGQVVPCTASLAVWADCEMVVAPGAPATVMVKAIVPATANDPEMLVLEAISVRAVDGQEVPLTGELTLRGVYPNEGLAVEAGTLLPTQVSKKAEIKV